MEFELDKTITVFKALSNRHRLQIMMWLVDPEEHFPQQEYGDLMDDGVCVGFITQKTGLKQPTVTHHMQILIEAGLVSSKQIKNWVFFKPVSDQIDDIHNVVNILGNKS